MRVGLGVRAVLVALALMALPAIGWAQISFNQIDTFETGSTLNWGNGQGTAAVTVSAGGPLGSNDHFLSISPGPGGRLIAFNRAQWVGNYNAAGVNAIEMDVINPSSTQIALRVAFKVDVTSFSAGYSLTSAIVLPPAQTTWQHVVVSLADANFTPISSPTVPLTTLLGSPAEMRILSSAVPSLNGDAIAATLGVDNIRAFFQPVPEPTSALGIAVCGTGAAAVFRRRWRRAGGSCTVG
ncbi:MAG: hypothetical protein U0746_20915 [Gemmataceae bacterium]